MFFRLPCVIDHDVDMKRCAYLEEERMRLIRSFKTCDACFPEVSSSSLFSYYCHHHHHHHAFNKGLIIIITISHLVSNFSSAGGGSSTIFAGGESEVIINMNSFNICKHLENHHHHDHDREHHHLPGSITTCHCAHWKPPPPSTRTTRAERRGSVYLETH